MTGDALQLGLLSGRGRDLDEAAMVAALDDDAHEREQRERYRRRRDVLLPAFRSAGFTVDYSDAGLYLWVTRGEPCRDTIGWLAQRGILAAMTAGDDAVGAPPAAQRRGGRSDEEDRRR